MHNRNTLWLVLGLLANLGLPAGAQTSAFTYQGRLSDNGQAANGTYDVRLGLFDAPANGNLLGPVLTNAPVAVSNGFFSLLLDFGAGAFNGEPRWLELGVRTNGSSAFWTLSPRQPLTATPYALFAANAGTVSNLASAGAYSGNGAGLTNLNGASIQAGTISSNQLDPAVFGLLTNVSGQALVVNSGKFLATSTFTATNAWSAASPPLSILLLGDSLIQGKSIDIGTILGQRFGFDGSGLNAVGSHNPFGGASFANNAFASVLGGTCDTLPPGGGVVFGAYDAYSPLWMDTLQVFYLTGPTNGTFSVEVSPNGASNSWTMVAAAVSTQAATNGFGCKTLPLALGGYVTRVTSVSGTCKIPGITCLRTASPGAAVYAMGKDGCSWSDLVQCPPSVLQAIGATLKPQLILIEETSNAQIWTQAPAVLGGILSGCSSNCDVVIIAPNPMPPAGEANNLAQIAYMRSLAQANGWVLFDEHALFGSYTNMVNAGLVANGDVHPNQTARLYSLGKLFDLTGLTTALSCGLK